MQFNDKIGNPITVGCYIAYGHALGRSAGFRIGRVLAIKGPKELSPFNWVPPARITVVGVDDDYNNFNVEHNYDDLTLCCSTGTLNYPSRIIVLQTIPEPMKKLLDAYEWKEPKRKGRE